MNEHTSDELILIEEWKKRFQKTMDEIVSLKLESNPELDTKILKEDYLLEKMATIYVGTIQLGRRVKELEDISSKSPS